MIILPDKNNSLGVVDYNTDSGHYGFMANIVCECRVYSDGINVDKLIVGIKDKQRIADYLNKKYGVDCIQFDLNWDSSAN